MLINNTIQLRVLEKPIKVIMFLSIYTVHIWDKSAVFLPSMVNLLLHDYTGICYVMHQFSNVNASPNITN